MKKLVPSSAPGREMVVRESAAASEAPRLRRTVVNGRSEMLPEDPFEVAKILRERRASNPAMATRARLLAAMRRRGIK